jgi:hypothetical protein
MTPTHITPEGSTLAPQKVLYTITSGKNTVHILEGFGFDIDGNLSAFEVNLNGRLKSIQSTVTAAQFKAIEILNTL